MVEASKSEGHRDQFRHLAPGTAELMLNAVLTSAIDFAIFTLDSDRKITSWNIGAQALLGWEASDILGQSADVLFTSEDLAQGKPEMLARKALAGGRAEDDGWHVRKDGSRFWSNGILMPLRGANEGQGFLKILRDRTDQWLVQQELRESEARFQHLADYGPAFVWITDPSGACTYLSRSWSEFTGQKGADALGFGWLDVVHPDDRGEVRKAFLQTNADRKHFQLEYRLQRADGVYCWMLAAGTPRFDEDGTFLGYVGSVLGITERKQAEEHQRILLAELQHRVRNTLAVIRLIMRRTAETSETIDEFTAHFDGRLNAFARVQTAVTRDPTAGVDLEHLVVEELIAHAAHEGDQVRVSGPAVRLQPKTAETLGLAIHELATNALKYGALATPKGRLKVSWQRRRSDTGTGRTLQLDWVEKGVLMGPLPSERRGFGKELLQRTLPYELGAKTAMIFDPDGLRCRIELPMTERTVL